MKPDELLRRIEKDPTNVHLYLDLARAWLDAGNESRSREIVLRRCRMPADAPTLVAWGALCEELGMGPQAGECYERALKKNPGDPEILWRLGSLFSETGRLERAIAHLQDVVRIDPSHLPAREFLARHYLELGLDGLASALAPGPERSVQTSPRRSFPVSVGRRDARRFLDFFTGREMGYTAQQVNRDTGQVEYVHHDAPLDEPLVARHIRGEITLAAYPLRSDNKVRYAAISLSIPPALIKANAKNRGYLSYLSERMKDRAGGVLKCAARMGLPIYPESNGGHIMRLWFFFSDFIHFLKVDRFLKLFVDRAVEDRGLLTVEPLLATVPDGLAWIENAVLLPLGIEPATGRRSFFLNAEGKPHAEQLKFLKTVRRIPVDALFACFRNKNSSGTAGGKSPAPSHSPVAVLESRCPVIGRLAGWARSGRRLHEHEKSVLFCTAGLLEGGRQYLHELLSCCPGYSFEAVERRFAGLPSRPAACSKIRECLPDVASDVACTCSFDLRGCKYPSPLLHIDNHLVPPADDCLLPEKITLKEAAGRYVDIRLHMEEIERTMLRLELILDGECRRKGIDRIRWKRFILRRGERDGCPGWKMERI